MVAVLLVFVVCLAVVLVLRVVLENVKFDLNDKPLCNLAIQSFWKRFGYCRQSIAQNAILHRLGQDIMF